MAIPFISMGGDALSFEVDSISSVIPLAHLLEVNSLFFLSDLSHWSR